MNNEIINLTRKYMSRDFYEKYNYTETDLGAIVSKDKTSFKVWSPIATKVTLNLFKDGKPNTSAYKKYSMELGEKGVWSYTVDEDLSDVYYTYSVTSFGKKTQTGDIYAKACGVNGAKSMVVNLKKTNPTNWKQDKFTYDRGKQPIIYELHVKDFSHDENSGVAEKFRGKYLAFTKENTNFKGTNTCIDHLKKLGVTHVQLMPVFDFATVDESKNKNEFNWGYDPVNYNVPEGSYSTNPNDGAVRIKEMKMMIQSLHKAGIGVIMDVVYNHTYYDDSYFERTVPHYYYRSTSDGIQGNGSGCGNETASERFMFTKYMIDSILYWVDEYHIDGFRFDLMGLHDTQTMNEIRNRLNQLENGENILMYGEPWSALEPSMWKGSIPANKYNLDMLDTDIAIFCDDTRDAIKGSVFDAQSPGYVNGNLGLANRIPASVMAWCCDYAARPSQIITYVSAHDNFTLYDKLVMSVTKNQEHFVNTNQDLIQLNKFCASIVFTSCGASFFQAGEEFARTKEGDGNSYNSSPEVNRLDWSRAKENEDLVNFYKDMIQFRKTIPVFMDKNADPTTEIKFIHHSTESMPSYIVSFMVKDNKNKDAVVVYNPLSENVEYELPKGDYKVICDGSSFVKKSPVVKNTVVVHKNACTILKKVK